ncbi:MAG: hypothetical protein IJ419_14965, partial [Agathobacter sp.]|nr:hypothetical protein [Agathobacter sp.]
MRDKKKGLNLPMFLAAMTLVLTTMLSDTSVVWADMPYDTYSYNYWGEEVKDPHVYLYTRAISAASSDLALKY